MHIKHYFGILEIDLGVEQFTDFVRQKLIPPHCLRNVMLHVAVVDHNVPSFTDVTEWIRRKGFINKIKKPPYSVRILNKVDPPRTRVST
jgi:hypothetical protein